jgi:hypothetical protein
MEMLPLLGDLAQYGEHGYLEIQVLALFSYQRFATMVDSCIITFSRVKGFDPQHQVEDSCKRTIVLSTSSIGPRNYHPKIHNKFFPLVAERDEQD